MKVTVCELPNDLQALENAWDQLVLHVLEHKSELVLLPEMPFFRWLAHTQDVDERQWSQAVKAHESWLKRLDEMAPATVIGTRPIIDNGKRLNAGYVREATKETTTVHTKYYLPDESGFWEATWYDRGSGDFKLADTSRGKVGFLICTEIWFNFRAREYGKQGMHLLVCPRATPNPTAPKWIAGGQSAAVVAGAFCLSSNLSGKTQEGGDYAGTGWIIEPFEGQVLGLTSADQPFLTIDIDLSEAERAKQTYPRYVQD